MKYFRQYSYSHLACFLAYSTITDQKWRFGFYELNFSNLRVLIIANFMRNKK